MMAKSKSLHPHPHNPLPRTNFHENKQQRLPRQFTPSSSRGGSGYSCESRSSSTHPPEKWAIANFRMSRREETGSCSREEKNLLKSPKKRPPFPWKKSHFPHTKSRPGESLGTLANGKLSLCERWSGLLWPEFATVWFLLTVSSLLLYSLSLSLSSLLWLSMCLTFPDTKSLSPASMRKRRGK